LKIFYGWRIVGAAMGIQFLHSALLIQAFGAYVALLSQEQGWSKTALAGGAAVLSIESALLGPMLGWLVDRFGTRTLIQIGFGFFAAGFVTLSQVQTLTGFYVSMLFMAVGASFSGYFPLSVALVHWFKRWRARALSIMGLGLAVGGVAMPLVGWAMQAYGWRHVAMASAVIAVVVGVPLARIVRSNPAEMGEAVDGGPEQPDMTTTPTSAAQAEAVTEGPDFTAAEALRTPAFWLLGAGHGLALLVVTAVNVHAITHMKEGLSYSLAQASVVITLMTVAQAGGVLLGAAMGDRWDKRYAAAACMLAHALGLLMLTFATHPVMLGLFAILHGGAWGLRGPFMSALRADYFGLRAIGMILGLSAIIISFGQVAGPLIAGYFADVTGNYRTGFTLLAVLAATGCFMFLFAKNPRDTVRKS